MVPRQQSGLSGFRRRVACRPWAIWLDGYVSRESRNTELESSRGSLEELLVDSLRHEEWCFPDFST